MSKDKFKISILKRFLDVFFSDNDIASYSLFAYHYAITVLEGRWYTAEPLIMKDPYWWDAYCRYFNIKEI